MIVLIKYTNGRTQTLTGVTSVAYVMGWLKVGREGTNNLLNIPADDILEMNVTALTSTTSENGQPAFVTA